MLDNLEVRWMVAAVERDLALARVARRSSLGMEPRGEVRVSEWWRWTATQCPALARWLVPAERSVCDSRCPACC